MITDTEPQLLTSSSLSGGIGAVGKRWTPLRFQIDQQIDAADLPAIFFRFPLQFGATILMSSTGEIGGVAATMPFSRSSVRFLAAFRRADRCLTSELRRRPSSRISVT